MLDTLVVGAIILLAVGFIVYRYFIKKSGGCSCGSGTCCNTRKKPVTQKRDE